MRELFIVILIAMGLFFVFGIVFQLFQNRKNTETRYTCSSCGEHDCVCHKE